MVVRLRGDLARVAGQLDRPPVRTRLRRAKPGQHAARRYRHEYRPPFTAVTFPEDVDQR